MNENSAPQKNPSKSGIFSGILWGVLLPVFVAVLGKVSGVYASAELKTVFYCIGIAATSITLLITVASIIGAKAIIKKNNQQSVKETQDYFNARRDSALDDLEKAHKRVVFRRRCIYVYTVFILLLGVTIGFSFSFASENTYLLGIVAAAYPFCAVFLRRSSRQKYDFSRYSKPEDYPIIYGIARRAADAVGCGKQIRIIFIPDFNAGISEIENVYSLQIGSELLSAMTEDELYQILIHEFAHVSKENYTVNKEDKLFAKLNNTALDPFAAFMNFPFSYFDESFRFEFIIYRMTASVAVEKLSDKAVLEHGDPQIAANALAKLAMYDKFQREMDRLIEEPFFEPEDFRKDYTLRIGREFRKAVEQRGEFWKQLLLDEIQSNNATHPIFRSRIEALGISDYSIEFPDEESDYRKEYYKVCETVDKVIYENEKESYAERRENMYLKPMRDIQKWIDGGRQVIPEESRPIMDALELLNRDDELEALCDNIIENCDNIFATAHAHRVKGGLMLSRYDKGGIDHIYTAVELNSNYIMNGLDIVGEYCCMCGWQEELEVYREKCAEYYQFQKDKYDEVGVIRHTDRISKDDLPDEMLKGIIERIRTADENQISRAYLIKKQISDDFFTSAVIIRFKPNADAKTVDTVMNRIFNYLDTIPDDRQFSLFVYDKNCEEAIDKVGDCCIYDSAD